MSEHLSVRQIEQYHNRILPAAELISALNHIKACDECRAQIYEKNNLEEAFWSLGPDLYDPAESATAHLSDGQIASYQADQLDSVDREIFDSHLELCLRCQAAIRRREPLAPSPAEDADRQSKRPARHGLLARLFAPHGVQRWLVLAALPVLLMLCAALFLLNQERSQLKRQLEESRQKQAALEQQVAELSQLEAELARLRQSQPPLLNPPADEIKLKDADGLVTIDEQGRLAGIKDLPASYESLLKAMLVTQKVKTPPALAELIGKPEQLMGSKDRAGAFALLSPVGTVIATNRPNLKWLPLKGASSYRVTIRSASGWMATSPDLSATEWPLDAPLKRGETYSWEVTAAVDGQEVTAPLPPAPQARFKVLEPSTATALLRARNAFSQSHLLLAALFAQAGLLDDAEQELKALALANPHSPLPQKLLNQIVALRHK